jgi:hypothetical protein
VIKYQIWVILRIHLLSLSGNLFLIKKTILSASTRKEYDAMISTLQTQETKSSDPAAAQQETSIQLISPAQQQDDYCSFIGWLGEIEQEARTLQECGKKLKEKVSADHPEVGEVTRVWYGDRQLRRSASQTVERCLKELHLIEKKDHILHEEYSKSVIAIQNAWKSAEDWPALPEDEQPLDVSTMLARIDTVDHQLQNMISDAAQLRLPDEINHALKGMQVGEAIDFQKDYSKDLPTPEAQTQALNYLYNHSLLLQGQGFVDVKNGLIYCISPNPLRQMSSILGNILAIILLGALVVLFYHFHVFSTDLMLQKLLTAYISVMVGGAVHYIVNAIKDSHADSEKTLNIVNNPRLWFHVMERPVFFGILRLFVGFLGIVILNLGTDLWTAFFAGYSIDSIFNLFLQRFADVSTARTNALTKQFTQLAPVKPK